MTRAGGDVTDDEPFQPDTGRAHDLWDVLGDLVDALADELRHEVCEADAVRSEVIRACRLLGPQYKSYLETWVGHVE